MEHYNLDTLQIIARYSSYQKAAMSVNLNFQVPFKGGWVVWLISDYNTTLWPDLQDYNIVSIAEISKLDPCV